MSPSLVSLFSDQRLVPIVVLIIALLFLMSSFRRRQNRATPPAAPSRASAAETGQLHRDLDALIVELQELSRRISAEIDTRFVKLEAAMRDADRRIAVLHRLTQRAGSDRAPAGDGEGDARHTVIYELADAGFTPVEIARDLGRTPGEVELILNLRKKTG